MPVSMNTFAELVSAELERRTIGINFVVSYMFAIWIGREQPISAHEERVLRTAIRQLLGAGRLVLKPADGDYEVTGVRS